MTKLFVLWVRDKSVCNSNESGILLWHYNASLWWPLLGEFFFLEDISLFPWGHWCPCFGLLVTSALSFKARVDPMHAFSLVWSSDLPLVQHLLTVWRSAWQLSLLNPCTYRCVCKHWWRFGLELEPKTVCSNHGTVNHLATQGQLGGISFDLVNKCWYFL